jgi:hypothetical protein
LKSLFSRNFINNRAASQNFVRKTAQLSFFEKGFPIKTESSLKNTCINGGAVIPKVARGATSGKVQNMFPH